MKKYLGFRVMVLLVFYKCAVNGLNEVEYQFNNCLTWRDDLDAVTLTCRIPDFSNPVTFYHNLTQTHVTCFINEEKPYCTPEGKNFAIDNSSQTVTIVLIEEKSGKNLNGTWFCIHGDTTLRTEVSFSEGIMVDSWVKINGSTVLFENGTKIIEVECSSCRKPQGLITEFSVNGNTEASVWQDDYGNCVHKSIVCSTSICRCASTGNLFSLHIQIPDNNKTAEFSCEMHFADTLRSGKFAKTAYMNYTGNTFEIKEPIARVIKDNEPIPTREFQTIDKGLTKPLSEVNFISVSPPVDSSETDNDVLIIIVTSVTVFAILLVVILIIYVLYRLRQSHSKANGNDLNLIGINSSEKFCQKCTDTCPNNANQAAFMCFDCRKYFCGDCYALIHDTSEKSNIHKCVTVEGVPISFSVSMLNCTSTGHQDLPIEFICNNHNIGLCIKCQESTHADCTTTKICDMNLQTIENYYSDLDSTLDDLSVLKRKVRESHDICQRQSIQVSRHLDSTTDKLISLEDRGKQMQMLTPRETKGYIKEKVVNKFLEGNKTIGDTICTFTEQIENQNLLMNFMAAHGETKHQIIFVYSLSMKLMEKKKKINEIEKKVDVVLIDFDSGNKTIKISTQILIEQDELNLPMKFENSTVPHLQNGNDKDEPDDRIDELTVLIHSQDEDFTTSTLKEVQAGIP